MYFDPEYQIDTHANIPEASPHCKNSCVDTTRGLCANNIICFQTWYVINASVVITHGFVWFVGVTLTVGKMADL